MNCLEPLHTEEDFDYNGEITIYNVKAPVKCKAQGLQYLNSTCHLFMLCQQRCVTHFIFFLQMSIETRDYSMVIMLAEVLYCMLKLQTCT